MRKYLYFLSADAHYMQMRLDKLAGRGLELVSCEGLFTGEFEESKRTDLRYLVVPYGNQKYFPRTVDFSACGWTLMGGFNGMAIFKSLPCVEPDRDGVVEKFKADGCFHPDKHTIPLLQGFLFVLIAVLFLLSATIPALAEQWYLTWFGIGMPVMRTVALVLLVANLLSLRTYAAAWIHGLTPWVLFGACGLYLIVGQLDHRGETAYFAVLLLFIGAAFLVSLWRMCRGLGAAIAVVCALVLGLGLLFPTVEVSATNLRGMAREAQAVTLADLGDDSTLSGSGFAWEGTVLVQKITYWEVTGEGNLTCEIYHCLTSALAEDAAQYEQSRSSADGTRHILRYGKSVYVVKLDRVIDQGTAEAIEAVLLP